MQHVPSNCLFALNGLHGVTSQKTEFLNPGSIVHESIVSKYFDPPLPINNPSVEVKVTLRLTVSQSVSLSWH
jgi:hypothetical protein